MDRAQLIARRLDALRKNNRLVLLFGILVMVLGLGAMSTPFMFGKLAAGFVGAILIVKGVMGVGYTFKAKAWGVGQVNFLGASVSLLVGILMIARPTKGLKFLTLLLATYFFVEGTSRVLLAIRLRPARGWRWQFLPGAAAIVFTVLILVQWPMSKHWAVGTFVGVSLFVMGLSNVILAIGSRRGQVHLTPSTAEGSPGS